MGAAIIDIYLSYWYQDEDLKKGLEAQLLALRVEGLVDSWTVRRFEADEKPSDTVDERLEGADLILFLVSSSFISLRYLWLAEINRALERHADGATRVVPVLLRPCQWHSSPFGELAPLPSNEKPITLWDDRGEALRDIGDGLRQILLELNAGPELVPDFESEQIRGLAQDLEVAYVLRADAAAAGADLEPLDNTILDLKAKMRRDGRLRAGDLLLGRYRLLRQVGEDPLAQDWQAEDREARQVVGVKVLQSRFRRDRRRHELFYQSAQQTQRLDGVDGVVQIVAGRCKDGAFNFFVHQFIDGPNFRQQVLNNDLSLNQRLEIILETGEILTAAHRVGVIHRDVRPQSIVFDAEGDSRLTDFDLIAAADTAGGKREAIRDRFLHVAPEVMNHGQVGPPADVYGLGMTTLFALHGEDIAADKLQDLPQLLAGLRAPAACQPVLTKALAWKPGDRWATAREFCDELHRAFIPVHGEPTQDLSKQPEDRQGPGGTSTQTFVIPKGPQDETARGTFRGSRRRAATRGAASTSLSGLMLPLLVLVGAVFGIIWLLSPGSRNGSDAIITAEPTFTAQDTTFFRDCEQLGRRLGIDLEYVSGGEYLLGTDEDLPVYGGVRTASERSQPQHTVRLSPFWLGTYPVTNEQYARFVEATDHHAASLAENLRFNGSNQAVVGVSWHDAVEFVEWADLQLPSEAQWEAAARGQDGSPYPWGDQPPTEELANFGNQELHEVGAHPDGTGPFGTLGQAGGVWEWTEDIWNDRPYVGREGTLDPVARFGNASRRVVRGGSWTNNADSLHGAVRLQFGARDRHRDNLGFRVACSPTEP